MGGARPVLLRGRHAPVATTRSSGTHPISSKMLVRLASLPRAGFPAVMLLLAGCVTHGPIIEQKLEVLESRLDALDEQLARIESLQAANHEALSEEQRAGIASLIEATTAEVNRLANERIPMPILIHSPAAAEDAPQRPQARSAGGRAASNATIRGKQLIGNVEDIHIEPPDVVLPARVDTGAESSSLDARELQEFMRDGSPWVRFHTVDSRGQPTKDIEQPVIRHVRIQQANSTTVERRPVIRLQVRIGSHTELAEFTLSDRSHLTYPVLIGRNVLSDVMVVDVSQSRLAPLIPPGNASGGPTAR